MMLIRLAWRNIWRNRRRSIIILSSIVLGCAAIIFTDGFYRGFLRQTLANQVETHIGHLQIHARGFQDNKCVENFMATPDVVGRLLASTPGVRVFSRRTITIGLLSSASGATGVMMVGIDPVEEARMTTIKSSIVQGSYLSVKQNEIVISQRMSETLEAKVGDRLVAMASASDGRIGSEMFRVVGLYRSPTSAFDRLYVYVGLDDARRMVRAGDSIAEFAVLVNDLGSVNLVSDSLRARLGESYEVLTYDDIVPGIVAETQMAEQIMLIFYFIIGLAMVFGVANTMLMSVFERIREFGVLKAVGMGNGRLFAMVMCEAIYIGCLGTLVGGALGIGSTVIAASTGLNFGMFSEGLAAWGSGAVIYPLLHLPGVFSGSLVIFCTSVAAAVYPALRAVRLRPIAALKHV